MPERDTDAVDVVVDQALEDIANDDWDRLRPKLHPYLHWKDADGRRLRGRKNVMAALMTDACPQQPSAYELRDEQIYRWIA